MKKKVVMFALTAMISLTSASVALGVPTLSLTANAGDYKWNDGLYGNGKSGNFKVTTSAAGGFVTGSVWETCGDGTGGWKKVESFTREFAGYSSGPVMLKNSCEYAISLENVANPKAATAELTPGS
ncbi:hypothetical protein [Paenibacillus sp. RC84]|uniref:hypothetical protein n=1 Tax=Paenibacillus sp. RC84 TaxID=3156252 RepID=UPI0035114875